MLTLKENVQKVFGKFAEIQVISEGELYGGKICAVLDRQHPGDLFDIKLLLEHEGFTDDIKVGFMALLISHARPIHEVLTPNLINQRTTFEKQFAGMTDIPFTYEDFEQTRINLIEKIQSGLTDEDSEFLISFKKAQPKWDLFPSEKVKALPAVRWKLQNIRKLMNANPDKHKKLLASLEKVLSF